MRRLLLLLLVALPLSAQDAAKLWMEPVAPTTSTPIVFYYRASCESFESIHRAGSVITIVLNDGPCSPPRTEPLVIYLPEGTLPPGEYRVNVAINIPTLPIAVELMRFVVWNDGPDAPFRVRPSAVSVLGRIPLLLEPPPGQSVCPVECRVFIGGAEATKTQGGNGALIVQAPPHAQGLVDVVIEDQFGLHTTRGVLYYFNPDLRPLPSVFEPILFPVLFNTPGANNSLWRTESSIANPLRWTVETANVVHPVVCLPMPGAPCGEILEPRTYSKQEGGNHPHGLALLVPRSEAPYLATHLRVRDVSQADDNLGSEVPVVRESDMAVHAETALLDVPLDPRYRVKLRIYAFDGSGEQSRFAIVRTVRHGSATAEHTGLTLSRTCSGASCAAVPYYGELDLGALDASARANIYVTAGTDGGTMTWAFASVTNNRTQQVTIISGNGGGTRR